MTGSRSRFEITEYVAHHEHVPLSESTPDFTDSWWTDRPASGIFGSVHSDDTEVARYEIELGADLSHYEPALDARPLANIQFFEVAASLRGQGVGQRVIAEIGTRYPDFRLAALSEEADGFWASLGWRRNVHPEHEESPWAWRPLYLQP